MLKKIKRNKLANQKTRGFGPTEKTMSYNKILDEKPLPEKLVKELNLDDVLMVFEMMKQELKNKISSLKTQKEASKALGMSQSDISDFMHGEKRRKWSYDRIISAIRRLEDYLSYQEAGK